MLAVNFILLFLIFSINCEGIKVTKPILNKCCNIREYLDANKTCMKIPDGYNVISIDIYDKNYMITSKSLDSVFNIVPGKFFKNNTIKDNFHDVIGIFHEFYVFLTEESVLVLEMPNVYNRFNTFVKDSDNFCYDYVENERKEFIPRFWMPLETDSQTTDNSKRATLTAAMLVSSVFLLFVLIVYALLPELRNLCGLILMAYVSSLFVAFVLLAAMRLRKYNNIMCVNLTCATYFFFLATFCWMSVMSYDIWWTFRGYAKARPVHRRGEWFKFSMYAIYGYGVPLAMTIFLRVINDVDLTHMPWFIKPNVPRLGCFIEGGQKLVYLYIPMMILLLCNWLFYLMTAFNVWRLSRGTRVLDSAAAGTPAAHRTQRQRFLVYLKLSVVMGLNWILEVGSFFVPSLNKLWFITDTYNLLIGVFIFIIFVGKPKILKKLIDLFKWQNLKKWVPYSSTRSTVGSVDNSTTQNTQTMQVCADPGTCLRYT